ncbi:MAG: M15 family metallopeptidase [Lachnospiraceae bacterium]
MNNKRIRKILLTCFVCILFCKTPVFAQELFTVTGKCTEEQKVTLEIFVVNESNIAGFDIYRADMAGGEYQYIGNVVADSWSYYYSTYDDYDEDNMPDYSYTDETVLNLYQTYYYRVMAYQYIDEEEETKSYIQSTDVSVFIVGAGPAITYANRKGKNSALLKWNPVSGADGYYIYCVSDMDSNGNMFYPDLYDESQYTLVKTINGGNQTSATFSKLTNGVTYSYRIYAYKEMNGTQILSLSSEIKSIPMDYYAYFSEDYTQKVKRAFGTLKKRDKNFKTAQKASKQMKTIKIKVWDFANGKSGKKVTKIKYLTVNKKLAPTIQQIFKEIYNSDEKQVIHDIGCYSYRTGQHMYGLAIDVNANENYMIDGKKIIAGKYWKPKSDPYSIPNNSEFVRIMRRYGFERGEWGDRKDYMHFSYFGT